MKMRSRFLLLFLAATSQAHAASFTVAIATRNGSPQPVVQASVASFTESVEKVLKLDGLPVLDIAELAPPSTFFDFEAQSNGNQVVIVDQRMDFTITYDVDNLILGNNKEQQIVQSFGKTMVQLYGSVLVGVAASYDGSLPSYYLAPPGQRRSPTNPKALATLAYWTPENLASAIPRDFIIDENGERRSLQRASAKDQRQLQAAIENAAWDKGGAVQTAVGRIYFHMKNSTGTIKSYICSGTVVQESRDDRSIILTAAHCAFDDVHKEFATDVLFIPNQQATTGSKSDKDCVSRVLAEKLLVLQ